MSVKDHFLYTNSYIEIKVKDVGGSKYIFLLLHTVLVDLFQVCLWSAETWSRLISWCGGHIKRLNLERVHVRSPAGRQTITENSSSDIYNSNVKVLITSWSSCAEVLWLSKTKWNPVSPIESRMIYSVLRHLMLPVYCISIRAYCHSGLTVYVGFLKDTKLSSSMGLNCWKKREIKCFNVCL